MFQAVDVNGDGLSDLIQYEPGTDQLVLYRRRGKAPDRLVTITGAENQPEVQVQYDPLINVHTVIARSFPLRAVDKGPWVVSRYGVSTGVGTGLRWFALSYEGATAEVTGRGWLGFSSRTLQDELSGQQVWTHYGNTVAVSGYYPEAFRVVSEFTWTPDQNAGSERDKSVTIQRTNTVIPGGGVRSYDHVITTVEEEYDERTSTLSTTSSQRTTREIDDHGNVTSTQVDTDELSAGDTTGRYHRALTVATYDNFAGNTPEPWLIGLLRSTTSTQTTPAGIQSSQTRNFDYYVSGPNAGKGLVQDAWTDRGRGADYELKAEFAYDSFGQPTMTTLSDTTGVSRPATTSYDSVDAVFPVAVTNALGQSRQASIHPTFGVTEVIADENGVRQEFKYDGFGQMRQRINSQGQIWTTTYTTDAQGRRTVSTTAPEDGTVNEVHSDGLGRAVQERALSFDTRWIVKERTYNDRGWLSSEVLPRFEGDASYAKTYEYDNYGRRTAVVQADGARRQFSYTGLTTWMIDETGRWSFIDADELGRPKRVVGIGPSNRQIAVTYAYDQGTYGLGFTATDPAGSVTSVDLDWQGRRASVSDSNAGANSYLYNAFGEVRQEQHPLGTTTYSVRDGLGRPTTVLTPDGTESFEWDTAPNGIGKLHLATSADGVVEERSYDAHGNLSELASTIESERFAIGYEYDVLNRVSRIQYPTAPGSLAQFSVTNNYMRGGTLYRVHEDGDLDGRLTWFTNVGGRNALGEITEAFTNNFETTTKYRYDRRGRLRWLEAKTGHELVQRWAYDYDAAGRMTSRADRFGVTSESYTYDPLGRLTRWDVTSRCGTSGVGYGYDDAGNIMEIARDGLAPDALLYEEVRGAGPHAVTSKENGYDTMEYSYDAAGNQISGDGRTHAYTWFNLPRTSTSGAVSLSYKYNADHQRALKRSGAGDATVYVGGLYERRTTAAGIDHVFLVLAGGPDPVAQVVFTQATAGGPVIRQSRLYLHSDFVGHVNAVTDHQGAVVERRRYDPFGNRMNPNSPTAFYTPPRASAITQGFAGHERDDELGLINMRGRMYDPGIGRFLSPDPLVSAPSAVRAYNRYAYAWNDPINLRDFNGFSADGGTPSAGVQHQTWTDAGTGLEYESTYRDDGGSAEITITPHMPSGDASDRNGSTSEILFAVIPSSPPTYDEIRQKAPQMGITTKPVGDFEKGIFDPTNTGEFLENWRRNTLPPSVRIDLRAPKPAPKSWAFRGGQAFGIFLMFATQFIGLGAELASVVPPAVAAEEAAAPTTRLWRAVEADELADIGRFGDYSLHPNSTFKRFAFSEIDVEAFIEANPGRSYTTTYVDLPTDKLRFMTEHPDPGGVGRAIGIDVYENPQFYDWFIGGVKVAP